MQASELRDKSIDELDGLRTKISRTLMDSRISASMGQLKNTTVLKGLRRDIARINTVIREKI
ncbi:MAG: 50S ribosomal protein L29 [Thermodesulfobacteriota bacterium]|nr:50S ribosomal protein L29 [Thermodesulfobacteriota bacterium]